MPDTPSETRQANEKIPSKGKLDKYKWWLVGGLAAIAVLVFYFVNKSKSTAAAGTSGTAALASMGIDPATGVPYSQEYANAYGVGGGIGGGGGGSLGFTGPAGSTGPRGATGPTGKGTPSPSHPKRHTVYWFQHHGYKVTKKGSRTDAMTQAVAARRAWNTRIVPAANKATHRV